MTIKNLCITLVAAGTLAAGSTLAQTTDAKQPIRTDEKSVLVKPKQQVAESAKTPNKPNWPADGNAQQAETQQPQLLRLQPAAVELQFVAPESFLSHVPKDLQPQRRLRVPLLPDLPPTAADDSTRLAAQPEELPPPVVREFEQPNQPIEGPRLVGPRGNTRPQPILPDAAPQIELRQAPRVVPGMFASFDAPVYPNVRVKDGRKIAPGSVPALVAVKDPHACKHDCNCCRDRMVFVEVWVPPTRPRFKVEDGGREVELDYGEYEVEIESKTRGYVVVDYDD